MIDFLDLIFRYLRADSSEGLQVANLCRFHRDTSDSVEHCFINSDCIVVVILLTRDKWTVYLHTVLRYLLNEPANNASLRQRLNLPESKSSTVSKLFRQAAEGGLVKPFDQHSSNKTKKYLPAWSQASSRIPVKTKDYDKLKLEEEKTNNSQNSLSNKAFIGQEDDQLIQKARQRLKELGI